MPLRHATETALLLILATAIAITGILVATLPAIPGGGFPWLLLMLAAIAYPLVLTPLFRSRRADTPFRVLHWIPCLMLLLWFLFEVLALYWPRLGALQGYYTYGWTLPLVAVSAILLVVYCLRVIRRRVPRLLLLALLFAPYAALGVASSRGPQWEGEVAASLWRGSWWQVFGSGAAIPAGNRMLADRRSSLGSIAASADSSEERWRSKIRASERRSEREEKRKQIGTTAGSSSSAPVVALETSSKAPLWRQSSSEPAALPSAGPGAEILALSMAALYCGVLHDRARRRFV